MSIYHAARGERATGPVGLAHSIAGTQGRGRVESSHGVDPDHQQPRQFAALLNQLFATRLAPSGRPYTLTEVGKATGMSVPYLSMLRKGTIGAIAFHRVEALARFFHVPLEYFSQEGPPAETMDDLVQEALAKPLVREVALRAGKIGTEQRALVLQMLEHADHVLRELAASAATPPAVANSPHPPEAPAPQES
jgi:ESX-1-secreted protein regulator